MQRLGKSFVAALAALVGMSAMATVTPGEWNTNFSDSLAYAEANHVPIVVVWGNTSCSYCKKLHAVLESDAIMDWAEEHPIMMVSKYEKYDSTDADYVAAKEWIKGLNSSISGFPYVGVYWKKSDGTVACKTAFEGRSGSMPVTKGTLAEQFAGSLDKLVGDYPEGGSAENAPINPHWVGEHTAATLPYGEWTMDFDVAKAKVRTYGGKLVAMFGGPLWCPNCVAIEDDVFMTSTFKAWAKEQKLVLVMFDQGQASSPATAAGTDRGRLLTTTPSTKGASGEEYLKRHNIDPDSSTVKSVIDRVTELTAKWLAPEATAARLGNPTVLLLNDAGTSVDARFLRQNEGYTMDLAENMCRLEDLISLEGDNEKKGYRTTTPLTLGAGESDEVEYHICSRKIAYRLTGLKAGDYVTATVSSDDADAQDVYVSLVTAAGVELVCAKKCALLTTPLTAEQAAGLYLMTAAYGKENSDVQSAFFGDATSFEATVSVEASEEKPEQFVSFKSLTKAEQKELNAELYKKQAVTVPVYESVNLGGKRLVGTLAVNVTSANKISAKFTGEKTVSFSGTWDEISQTSGLVKTTLAKTVSRVAYTLDLAMDASGGFEATLKAGDADLGAGAATAGDASSYVGSYTVTLVDKANESGTGYLTMKITKTGKVTVSGLMPNGTSVSTSVVLSPNADGTATVPVYKSSAKGTLSLALAVKPDAAETWGEESPNTVGSVTGCFATWTADDTIEFDVYGGYWQSTTPLAICENYNLSDELAIVMSGETNDTALATKSGFKLVKPVNTVTSLSFAKSTGVFSGKAKIVTVAGAKAVTATIKGVLLPGWINCSSCGEETGIARPYGSGTAYYKVGKTVVSMPIDFVAEGE